MKCGRKVVDLTGQVFGSWTVIGLARVGHEARWNCVCVCGNEREQDGSKLRKGGTVQCKQCRSKEQETYAVGEMPLSYWNRIIIGAENRGLEFSITPEYAYQGLIDQDFKCALTGASIGFRSIRVCQNQNNIKHTASLDRINSSKGYIVGNMRWLHKDINTLKTNLPDEDFILLCRMVAQHYDNTHKGI